MGEVNETYLQLTHLVEESPQWWLSRTVGSPPCQWDDHPPSRLPHLHDADVLHSQPNIMQSVVNLLLGDLKSRSLRLGVEHCRGPASGAPTAHTHQAPAPCTKQPHVLGKAPHSYAWDATHQQMERAAYTNKVSGTTQRAVAGMHVSLVARQVATCISRDMHRLLAGISSTWTTHLLAHNWPTGGLCPVSLPPTIHPCTLQDKIQAKHVAERYH